MNTNKSIRLESVRVIVDEMLLSIKDTEERRGAYLHLYGVSQTASMLAMKRGLNVELGAIIGMFHDYYVYLTGVKDFHDQSGAEAVRPIIRDMGIFTEDEQGIILSAIFHHSDKKTRHSAYDELIKDADVLQHYLYNTAYKVKEKCMSRLKKVLDELSVDGDVEAKDSPIEMKQASGQNRRSKLADVAERLALKEVIGVPGDGDFRQMCSYWPGDNIYKEAMNSWCALFVYHCCREVGIVLPIKHPKGYFRYAAVGAWQDWAIFIGETYHDVHETDFIPNKGDIVIYDKLLADEHHDHIGIVLSCEEDRIVVAEGNVDNKNYSGIVKRSRVDCVAGYVRISNEFSYSYHGTYEPRLK